MPGTSAAPGTLSAPCITARGVLPLSRATLPGAFSLEGALLRPGVFPGTVALPPPWAMLRAGASPLLSAVVLLSTRCSSEAFATLSALAAALAAIDAFVAVAVLVLVAAFVAAMAGTAVAASVATIAAPAPAWEVSVPATAELLVAVAGPALLTLSSMRLAEAPISPALRDTPTRATRKKAMNQKALPRRRLAASLQRLAAAARAHSGVNGLAILPVLKMGRREPYRADRVRERDVVPRGAAVGVDCPGAGVLRCTDDGIDDDPGAGVNAALSGGSDGMRNDGMGSVEGSGDGWSASSCMAI